MQRKAPSTPQSRRLNRTTVGASCLPDHRSAVDVPVGSRRQLPPGQSSMPNATSASGAPKEFEPEGKDSEMKYLYNEYLRTEAIKLLSAKKKDKSSREKLCQLATLKKEEDAVKEELFAAKTRERDLKNLVVSQNGLDEEIDRIRACLDVFGERPSEVFEQLRSALNFLDVLKTRNITIPRTSHEMEKVCGLMEKCASCLLSMNQIIGRKHDVLTKTNEDLRDIEETYADAKNLAEKCAESLEQLQLVVLRGSANSLTEARNGQSKSSGR